MKSKPYSYKITVKMTNPDLESPIMDLFKVLSNEARRINAPVCKSKALAINMKWSSLSFLRAEIKALDKMYAASPSIRFLDKSLIISKIETYLSVSRAILDILAYCLSKSFGLGGYAKSFNGLRKNQGIPQWFSSFVTASMAYDDRKSMSDNGWLLNLLTDRRIHGDSLRDFVNHSGTIDLESAEQFGGGYRFCFGRRSSDQFHYRIESMVDNVYKGICDLFNLVITNLTDSKSEQQDAGNLCSADA